MEHPIFGDLHVETRFSNFQDVGGLMAPPPGVYRITGGYVSPGVEFKDYVVVVEAGQNKARGLAVPHETRRLFPQKRVKYVVNTRAHFDHAGGLPLLLPAFGQPRTLMGDALAKSKKKPVIDGVEKKLVLRDATRTLELHHVEQLEHSDGMAVEPAVAPQRPSRGMPWMPITPRAPSRVRAHTLGQDSRNHAPLPIDSSRTGPRGGCAPQGGIDYETYQRRSGRRCTHRSCG